MKVIYIAYADSNCAYSLKMNGKQAAKLGIFNEIILYTPEMLPDYIKNSQLMQYSRGGGYWAWKPVIIYETLKSHEEGDIVVYMDAGSEIQKSSEWTIFLGLMKNYDTICFQYDDDVPYWEKFGTSSTKIKYWSKKRTLEFFDNKYGDKAYREYNKIMGGCLFMKGKDNSLLKEWMDITLNHPDLIIDPNEEELRDQEPYFVMHRHDQSILTPLAFYDKSVLAIPEVYENYTKDSFAKAVRCRAANKKQYIVFKIKQIIKSVLGNKIISVSKRIFK